MYNVFTDNSINTQPLPSKSSLINYSLYKELFCPLPFRSFSVKYVSEGCENYTVNGSRYQVKTGQYLLANHFSEGFIEIESKNPVKGICVDVAPDLLSEVVGSFRRPDTPYPDTDLDIFFNTGNFFENKYQIGSTNVGRFLQQLDNELSVNPFGEHRFTNEFYFNLAETIVADHVQVYRQLQSVPSVRSATRKDLLRKLYKAKDYIDQHYLLNLEVKDIAAACFLSEYHFFRLFKSVFGISPHQYTIVKRLEFARQTILKEQSPLSEIAVRAGFSDNSSFSKSFKRHFGFAPSSLVKGELAVFDNS
jgi:AraC-like DNA-binding protein